MNIKKLVYQILKRYPVTRDKKKDVVYNVLISSGLSMDEAAIVARHYDKAATIDRAWRQCQQQNPELRGQDWNKRQAKQEEVQRDLGYKV